MKLSEQAITALVVISQKCLIEGENIADMLRDLEFVFDEEELFCMNPPTSIQIDFSSLEDEDADL